MARAMVTRFGMSDSLGPIAYAENQEEVFLGHSVSRTQNISEATAQKIDSEIHYFEPTPPSSGMNIRMEIARLFVCPHCHKILGVGTVG